MASKSSTAALALLLCLSLLSSTLVSAGTCPPSPKKPKPTPSPRPRPTPSPSPRPAKPSCPVDTLKLGACADLLGGLLNILIGTPPKTPCCSLIEGLSELEAAVCLCTAIKGNVLGINVNLNLDLTLLINYCGKEVPYGYLCA